MCSEVSQKERHTGHTGHTHDHTHKDARTHTHSCCFTYSYKPMAEQTPPLLMCRQPACQNRMRAREGRHSERTRARARRVRSAAFGIQTNSDSRETGREKETDMQSGKSRLVEGRKKIRCAHSSSLSSPPSPPSSAMSSFSTQMQLNH